LKISKTCNENIKNMFVDGMKISKTMFVDGMKISKTFN
jgi:hypothetical protein